MITVAMEKKIWIAYLIYLLGLGMFFRLPNPVCSIFGFFGSVYIPLPLSFGGGRGLLRHSSRLYR